jgi:ketosteroid isomerase-like protein
LAAAVACFGICHVQAQASADSESKVRALERLWGAAAQLRDIKALDSIFDDSLAYVDMDGKLMNKAEVLADTKTVSTVNIVVESSDASAHGACVIVVGVLRLKGWEGTTAGLRIGSGGENPEPGRCTVRGAGAQRQRCVGRAAR